MNKVKPLITLEERLELQRMRFLNDHVYNVREVEHLGMNITLCETLYGSTKVFDHDKYQLIGKYDGLDIYQKIPHIDKKKKL